MGEIHQNTNLASEYYALSMMYRVGANAYLTLGNKKSVDILIDRKGATLTADVKGLKDTSCFPIDNCDKIDKNHYLIFISYIKKIDDPKISPEVYIVPSVQLEKPQKALDGKSLVYRNPKGNRQVVQLSRLRKLKDKFQDQWQHFV